MIIYKPVDLFQWVRSGKQENDAGKVFHVACHFCCQLLAMATSRAEQDSYGSLFLENDISQDKGAAIR